MGTKEKTKTIQEQVNELKGLIFGKYNEEHQSTFNETGHIKLSLEERIAAISKSVRQIDEKLDVLAELLGIKFEYHYGDSWTANKKKRFVWF